MSKQRLQVLLDPEEFDALRASARRQGIPVSDYVRGALREARRREPSGDIERKLRAIERAMQYEFPTPDIDQLLAEMDEAYMKEFEWMKDLPE
jgi:hypothetical protein